MQKVLGKNWRQKKWRIVFLIRDIFCSTTVLLILQSVLAYGMYDSSDDVIELTDSNFDRQVVQSDSIWVVEFYAPWCGHCQQLAPEYKKTAKALKVSFKIFYSFINLTNW